MGQILSNWRIASASLVAAVILAGAYGISRIDVPSRAEASAETALLQALATKDSTGDGLPDWQKALYGIPLDATTTDYFHLGMTDGEAVAKGLIVPKAIADVPAPTSSPVSTDGEGLPPPPQNGTLTAAFADRFMELYTAAKAAKGGTDLSPSEQQDVAQQALAAIPQLVVAAPDFKSANDLVVSGTGAAALADYAASVEAVFAKNNAKEATSDEAEYLSAHLYKNDASALAKIGALAASYRNTAAGLAALTVPSEAAADHLVLVNGLMRKSEIASDLVRVDSDPLSAIIALEQYSPTLQSIAGAMLHLGQTFVAEGVSLPQSSPGGSFAASLEYLATQYAAQHQP